MDRLKPRYLTRDQLRGFLGQNPEMIRAFETFVEAISILVPDELNDLQLNVASVAALQSALATSAEEDRRDTESARMLALSAQIDQLREQITPPDESALVDLQGQIAQLREQIAALPMKPKRIVPGSILMTTSVSGTFTVSPPITGLAKLNYLGCTTTDTGANLGSSMVAISLSGSVVTATRSYNGGGISVTVNFEVEEFPS